MHKLNEEISEEEAKCLTLLSFAFLNYMANMTKEDGKYFKATEKEILDLVRADVPSVDDKYSRFLRISQKREFLKEVLIEYLVIAFIDHYKKYDKTIDDWMAGHMSNAKRYRGGRDPDSVPEPEIMTNLKKCLRNSYRYEPSFHISHEKGQASPQVAIPADDTVGMALRETKKLPKISGNPKAGILVRFKFAARSKKC